MTSYSLLQFILQQVRFLLRLNAEHRIGVVKTYFAGVVGLTEMECDGLAALTAQKFTLPHHQAMAPLRPRR